MRVSKRKRDVTQKNPDETTANTKKKSDSEIVKLICKAKLDALDQEENLSKDNRFTFEEKRRLLEAYQEKGYPVFQDTKLLSKYLPNRREADLKGLLERLKLSLSNQLSSKAGTSSQSEEAKPSDKISQVSNVTKWQDLSRKLMNKFAQNKKVGIDDVYTDTLMDLTRDDVEMIPDCDDTDQNIEGKTVRTRGPDYRKILASLSQLMEGKFPERPTGSDASIMMRLFDDLNTIVSNIDLSRLDQLAEGRWLHNSFEPNRKHQESALVGLDKIDPDDIKRDEMGSKIESDRNLEALCLELPKIKRITDVLNPLHIDKAMVNVLIEQVNGTSN